MCLCSHEYPVVVVSAMRLDHTAFTMYVISGHVGLIYAVARVLVLAGCSVTVMGRRQIGWSVETEREVVGMLTSGTCPNLQGHHALDIPTIGC